MSTNQFRLNPSQSVSNLKGRRELTRAWPSTAVSTWHNGGLFAGGINWAYGSGGDTTASVTIDGQDWRYHIFNSSGTFNPDTSNTTYGGKYPAYIELFVVGGGGGGGAANTASAPGAGGGGAGSAREFTVDEDAPENTGMLLANDSDNVTVTIGAGGNGGAWGTVSVAGGDTSVTCSSATPTGRRGGDGGTAGQGVYDTMGGPGGSGNNSSPLVAGEQGSGGGGGGGTAAAYGSITIHNNGGVGGNRSSYGDSVGSPTGGHNGAHGAKNDPGGARSQGGAGGSSGGAPQTGGTGTYSSQGVTNTWTGSNVYYACGGAGLMGGDSWGTSDNINGTYNGVTANSTAGSGAAGSANTGSGGGGGNHTSTSAAKGGSGIVIIRYKV